MSYVHSYDKIIKLILYRNKHDLIILRNIKIVFGIFYKSILTIANVILLNNIFI